MFVLTSTSLLVTGMICDHVLTIIKLANLSLQPALIPEPFASINVLYYMFYVIFRNESGLCNMCSGFIYHPQFVALRTPTVYSFGIISYSIL